MRSCGCQRRDVRVSETVSVKANGKVGLRKGRKKKRKRDKRKGKKAKRKDSKTE